MRWLLIFNNILIYLCLACENLKRPKIKEDCFQRTFTGEYNETNSYCCFLSFLKYGWTTYKCSLHSKDEIDDDAVFSTIDYLRIMNSQENGPDVAEIKLDCKSNFIKYLNIYIYISFIFILI